MGNVLIGTIQKAKALLTKHCIVIPTSDNAIMNLYDFITQPDVRRNKIPVRERVSILQRAQATWIGRTVIEKGTGKRGVIRFITARRGYSDCFYRTDNRDVVFVAVIDWLEGGCHRGMGVSQLTLADSPTQASS